MGLNACACQVLPYVKDKRLAPGIWKTSLGYRVLIRIGGRLESKRFPPTYTIDALKRWREDHIRLRRPARASRGTFARDVEDYLPTVQTLTSYTDRVRDLHAWLEAIGPDVPRWRITPDQIRTVLSHWKAEGYANQTCNNRRTALSHLYTVLDGKNAYNPVKEVPPFPQPLPLKRGLPMATVMKVLRKIEGPKTRARLEVLAWTGLRPSELMRLTPELVNLKAGTAIIPTGKGGPAREISFGLAAKAWKRLVKADALGKFDVHSARKSLVRACKKANVTPFRVYDLRHSFASALRRSGADLSDVQSQLGHSDIKLTRRYAPTITAKLKRAVRKLA